MSEQTITSPSIAIRYRWLSAAALCLAVILLAVHAAFLLALIASAIRFPFGIDYGEGIVWQQMKLVIAGHAYGRIDGFPAIVFHYTPLYYLLADALHATTGVDELAAGRIVSAAATALTSTLAGLIIFTSLRRESGSLSAIVCAVIGGLVILSFIPVQIFSALMRVDMAAIMFSFAGVYFALSARMRRELIHLAALCFLAAVFTKQVSIAAPAATFLTLLFVQPRTAVAGAATTLVVGVTIAASLTFFTDGNFLRHIFLYNINRLKLSNYTMFAILLLYVGYIYVVLIGLAWRMNECWRFGERGARFRALRKRLTASPYDTALFLFLVYFCFAAAMLAFIFKSGASVNYFIEFMCVTGVLVGLLLRTAAMTALGAVKSQPNMVVLLYLLRS